MIRRAFLMDREFVIVPMTLMKPGVMHGSGGRLLYPREEIERNPGDWNYVPITVGHPEDENGRWMSARDPGVLNRVGIGYVFGAEADGKLTAEGWFDVENTRRLSPETLHAVAAGQPFELSTGLMFDRREVRGTYHGRRFEAIATNFIPDHLAVLHDERGACSVRDGCGVNVA